MYFLVWNLKMSLAISICDALSALLPNLVECVLHDLDKQTICYISGTLSSRKIGDPSFIETESCLTNGAPSPVYTKTTLNGETIRSISIPIDNKWLLCINIDTSAFSTLHKMLEHLLNAQSAQKPEALFRNDWQEKAQELVASYIHQRHFSPHNLSLYEKKEIVYYLFKAGVFSEKKASDFIAKTLSMGRATIFKYLKEWKSHDNQSF